MLFEKQQYQDDCVQNIVNILKNYNFEQHKVSDLYASLKKFYESNNSIPIKDLTNSLQMDIEMETGTGKTFTYLKTIFELNKYYQQNKFIIFVPRKAIREGVLQNIDLTSDYFFQQYGKRLVKYTYDSKISISKIKNHYLKNNEELSVLVLTNSSIDKKDTNIIHKFQEDLFGDTSVFHALQKINPIVFIDEPHLLKGEAFSRVFKEFKSLCFRFGATFPREESHKLSNMAYSLDSITSFKSCLVKKIRVNTIITKDSQLKVHSAASQNAVFLYFQDNEEHKKQLEKGEDIGIATGISDFNGISIVNISTKDKKVYLSNKTGLTIEDSYELSDEETRLMIRKTIQSHFAKEEFNFNHGVKTLSLFFIPSIADFRGNNPRIKILFEEEYKLQRDEILQSTANSQYKKYLSKDFDENGITVCEGYFSGDTGSKDDQITKGVDLILRDKEKLLSFDTSLRFIFSVWALQEGWDNPNVFNICKLSSTDKETSRRQQIGRGLRLCVNQEGKRFSYKYCGENPERFYQFNTLDVIVSGKEKNFIEEIQNEILASSHIKYADNILAQDYFISLGLDASQNNRLTLLLEDHNMIKADGDKYQICNNIIEFIKENKAAVLNCRIDEPLYDSLLTQLSQLENSNYNPPVSNGNKEDLKVKIKQDKLGQFKELWETINQKSRIVYANIQEDHISGLIADKFNKEDIPAVHTQFESKEFNAQTNSIEKKKVESLGKIAFLQNKRYKEFMLDFVKTEKLPLNFVIKLFNRLDREKLNNNPSHAKIILRSLIKDSLHNELLQSVEYQLEGTTQITALQKEDGSYLKELPAAALGRFAGGDLFDKENYLYDRVVWDSNFEKEIIESKDFENIGEYKITVFAKLPRISIPTPYKSYNPDFAYLLQTDKGKTLFLVVESKGYNKAADIPLDEAKKIAYAEKFFEKLQKSLPDIDIIFKKRINGTELSDLLAEIKGK